MHDATRGGIESTASGYIDIAPNQPTDDITFTIDVSSWGPGFYKVGIWKGQLGREEAMCLSRHSGCCCLPSGQVLAGAAAVGGWQRP